MDHPIVLTNARRWREHHKLTLQTVCDVANAALARSADSVGVPRWDVTALSKFERRTRNHYSIARLAALSDATRALRPGDGLSLEQLADRTAWAPTEASAARAVA